MPHMFSTGESGCPERSRPTSYEGKGLKLDSPAPSSSVPQTGTDPTPSPRWPVPLLARFFSRGDRGRLGEAIAKRHFRRAGYRVVARNVRMRAGEVDLIARARTVLVFVEVRTRQPSSPLSPEESVDRRKQSHLVRAAQEWLARHPHPKFHIRFDVVAVELDDAHKLHRFAHYERAFEPPRHRRNA